MFGGFSSISSAGFFATFIAFATGGANPWLLGIAAGAGLTIGDSFFYYLGLQGRGILSEKFRKQINRLSNWFSKQKSWKVQVFVFIYAGFMPLPNDILSVSLAIAGYPYKKIIAPLLLGNIIFMTLLAFFIPFASQQFA